MKFSKFGVCALIGSAYIYAGGIGEPVEPIDNTPEQEIEIVDASNEAPSDRFERSDRNNKFYIGAAAGSMRSNGENDAKGASASLVAGYTLSQYSKIEGRFATLIADADYGNGTKSITMNNTAIYLKQLLPIANVLSPYALVGYGKSKFDGNSDSGLQWGLGANYMLNDKVDLFVDYVSYYSGNFDGVYPEDIDLTSFNVGSTYTF